MKDRLTLTPGRIKLEPVTGQDKIYDLTYADNPTQEGTPLNKANLLTDETADKIWGALAPEDPSVDDAINALASNSGFEIGDTLTTARKDLGDKWLECSGGPVDEDAYPELAALLPEGGLQGAWEEQIIYNNTSYRVSAITNNGAYYVAAGVRTEGGTYYLDVYYTQNLNDNWNRTSIKTSSSSFAIGGIAYGNGYFVISWSFNYSMSVGGMNILYATSPELPWASKSIASYSYMTRANSVRYVNNTFVICGRSFVDSTSGNSNAIVWYADLPTSSWSSKTFGGLGEAISATYGDGNWAVLFCPPSGSSYLRIYYGDTLENISNSSYTQITPSSGIIGNSYPAFTYGNGYFVFINYNTVFFSTSVNGTYEQITIPSELGDNSIQTLLFVNNMFVFSTIGTGNSKLYACYTNNPSEWTTQEISTVGQNTYDMTFNQATGTFATCSQWPKSVNVTTPNCFYKKVAKTLPNITLSPETTTYIKALD